MTKNLVSDPILAPLAQICPLKFFSWVLPLLDIMQFQEKLMNQTWENRKKPSFETDFDPFGPNLNPKNVFQGFYLY